MFALAELPSVTHFLHGLLGHEGVAAVPVAEVGCWVWRIVRLQMRARLHSDAAKVR